MDALQVVAEPRRREILRTVWRRERSAGEIAAVFDVSFAAVSQHLAVLKDAGMVSVRKEGRKRLYRADRESLGALGRTLEELWGKSLDRLVELAEGRGE